MPVYFFEIPIYRCSEERFLSRRDKALVEHLKWLADVIGVSRERAPVNYNNTESSFIDSYGGPWRYNQIIGWLRMSVGCSSIAADLWLCDAKRYARRMRYKRFYYRGTVLVAQSLRDLSSERILFQIMSRLREYNLAWRKRRIVLDLDCLARIGPSVDWRSMLESVEEPIRAPKMLERFEGTPLALDNDH
jgi:hypothetical protein